MKQKLTWVVLGRDPSRQQTRVTEIADVHWGSEYRGGTFWRASLGKTPFP